MNADELRAMAGEHRRARRGTRAVVAWHEHTADALDQAASDRETLERVRAHYEALNGWCVGYFGRDEPWPGGLDQRLSALRAALRDEQEGGTR
jgi:hypothetical protein